MKWILRSVRGLHKDLRIGSILDRYEDNIKRYYGVDRISVNNLTRKQLEAALPRNVYMGTRRTSRIGNGGRYYETRKALGLVAG